MPFSCRNKNLLKQFSQPITSVHPQHGLISFWSDLYPTWPVKPSQTPGLRRHFRSSQDISCSLLWNGWGTGWTGSPWNWNRCSSPRMDAAPATAASFEWWIWVTFPDGFDWDPLLTPVIACQDCWASAWPIQATNAKIWLLPHQTPGGDSDASSVPMFILRSNNPILRHGFLDEIRHGWDWVSTDLKRCLSCLTWHGDGSKSLFLPFCSHQNSWDVWNSHPQNPSYLGLSENSVPLHPMVNDHYPY